VSIGVEGPARAYPKCGGPSFGDTGIEEITISSLRPILLLRRKCHGVNGRIMDVIGWLFLLLHLLHATYLECHWLACGIQRQSDPLALQDLQTRSTLLES